MMDSYIIMKDKYEDEYIIMSGKCPEKESVDNWAIEWAIEHDYQYVEVPPLILNKDSYFFRNKVMAFYADEIMAFIPSGQFRSGAWNCISEFRKMGKTNYRVFDENGKEWDRIW